MREKKERPAVDPLERVCQQAAADYLWHVNRYAEDTWLGVYAVLERELGHEVVAKVSPELARLRQEGVQAAKERADRAARESLPARAARQELARELAPAGERP